MDETYQDVFFMSQVFHLSYQHSERIKRKVRETMYCRNKQGECTRLCQTAFPWLLYSFSLGFERPFLFNDFVIKEDALLDKVFLAYECVGKLLLKLAGLGGVS